MARTFTVHLTGLELQDLLDALPTERPRIDPFGDKTRRWNLRYRLARLQWAEDRVDGAEDRVEVTE